MEHEEEGETKRKARNIHRCNKKKWISIYIMTVIRHKKIIFAKQKKTLKSKKKIIESKL